VRTALGSLEGTSLLGLDGATVERRLAELPDVASASYDRAFPHALHVVVRPEIPVGVLRLGRDAWVVSARARVIARSSPGALPGAPRVWLAPGTQVEVGQTLAGPTTVRAVRALATLLRAPGRIRVGNVRSTAGEFTLLLRSGIEVRLGNGRDLALKLAVTERILPRVAGPGYLDVSAPERPVFGSKSQPAG
jgi:cell division protein FtsQ